ncbi:RNA polymerase sigma factor [Alkalihalobacillus sp. MEB130]|uniref:RNA polymerase sigma factor n=1 Tax=Alkalihalobacillus sp. MEB130 TaxID=2976704 RepID=UPI0028DF6A9C|nr:RNA polymerase sigma factor [Alkalihalobacillus sp. MEB130]MDT8861285.1 RNA polymerase sigma factor [Alkalihalobacillus sp. MEB130]
MGNHDLITCIKKKDLEALINWIDEKKSKYYKIGWAYLRSHHDIEDVFQNTILKVYENIHQLKKPQYFETWVTTIFINECKSIHRKTKKVVFESKEPVEDMSQDKTRIELLDGVEKLEEQYKEVIILKYISDISQEEIAALLHIPIGTVKSRLFRGLKLLRIELQRGEL